MRHLRLSTLALAAALLAAGSAHATIDLIATATLSGTATDLSGLTAPLEDGVAGNLLGGMGSGLAWAGGNTFLALPDRGPNATAYDSLVDDTVSYINRFQTVTLALNASAAGSALPFTLTPTLTGTTLLSSSTALTYGSGVGLGTQINGAALGSGAPVQNTAGQYYFTGRSDNFDPAQNSLNPNNGRLDTEGIRVSADGKSVFISDEYGPYVYQFDRATGVRLNSFALPQNLAVANLSAVGAAEISGNTSGRTANKGMEGLAITPDGKTLVGVMQAALIQDKASGATKTVRIVTIDIASGTTHEYAYNLTSGSGVSEIVALNDHQFLVDERDGNGIGGGAGSGAIAAVKQIFSIDLQNATDVTNLSGTALKNAAVNKSLFVDLVTTLNRAGITDGQIPSKIEGLAFGADVTINGVLTHTLYVANDNDYNAIDPDTGVANPNRWYVLGVTDADLAAAGLSYVAQAVPEPQTWAMFAAGLGLLGGVWRRRR